MKKILLSVAALALAGSAFAVGCPGPDAFGHTCGGPCASLPSPGTNIGNVLFDDSCTIRNIGFTFSFYGSMYTQVGVSSNGQMVMGSCTGGTDFTNDCPIPNTFTPNGAAYGVWDDLNNGGNAARIREQLTGAAPNRIYYVEWTAVPYFSGGGTASFQVQLYENGGAGNEVRVQITGAGQPGYTTGIESPSGTDALSFSCNTGGTQCTRYSGSPAPPGGDCDLTPVLTALNLIENKLDTDIPADLAAILTEVTNISAANCEIIRLLHTPQGRRTSSSADNGGCGDFTWNQDHGGGE